MQAEIRVVAMDEGHETITPLEAGQSLRLYIGADVKGIVHLGQVAPDVYQINCSMAKFHPIQYVDDLYDVAEGQPFIYEIGDVVAHADYILIETEKDAVIKAVMVLTRSGDALIQTVKDNQEVWQDGA